MGNRMYRPSRFEHPTETDPRVLSYLEKRFGSRPEVNENGADLALPDGTRVEVKSCSEWCKTSCSVGTRRRGRFQIHGYEDCDYFLFVIVREQNLLEMYLMDYITAIKRFGTTCTINWKSIVQPA